VVLELGLLMQVVSRVTYRECGWGSGAPAAVPALSMRRFRGYDPDLAVVINVECLWDAACDAGTVQLASCRWQIPVVLFL
jgi:hypothetical protein